MIFFFVIANKAGNTLPNEITGNIQVQNKMFNLHIIQIMYKIGKGQTWTDPGASQHIYAQERGENTSDTNKFYAINSMKNSMATFNSM